MKVCPKCGAQMNDTDTVCAACGMRFESGAPNGGQQTNNWQQGAQQQNNWQQPPYQFDPYDHTTEFDPKDISDNKVIAMLCYLLGTVGVIIALLGSNSSPYAGFHVSSSPFWIFCSASSPQYSSGRSLSRSPAASATLSCSLSASSRSSRSARARRRSRSSSARSASCAELYLKTGV